MYKSYIKFAPHLRGKWKITEEYLLQLSHVNFLILKK